MCVVTREMFASLFVFVAVVGSGIILCEPGDSGESETYIRLFHGTIDQFTEVPIEIARNLLSTPLYNSSKGSVFFAHGFTGRPDGPAVTAVIGAYLAQGESNVFLLNWQQWASVTLPSIANSYLNWAAPNARKLGPIFADALLDMSSAGFELDRSHLVGHSLGAQIFGLAGNYLVTKDVILPWITGLDPASMGFENRPPNMKLNANSAAFVEIVHSDPSKYGYKRPHGTVDYWPNFNSRGPVRQPGCDNGFFTTFSPQDLCDHNRCWQLLVDSIKYPGTLMGCYAKNYRAWKNNSGQEKQTVTLAIGTYNSSAIRGDYYFTTNSKSPYGLGPDGL